MYLVFFVITIAGLLGFSNDDIARFQRSMQRPGGSPTEEMLTTWDYENHTIEELYLKLYELKHARCMMFLKDLVRPDLHYLIQKISNSDPVVPEPPVLNAVPPLNQFQQGPANIPLCPGENQFGRSVSPRCQQYPPQNPNYPPFQNQLQQQQHWGQSSVKTPSTVSYHSSNANHAFPPVDPRMMVSTKSQQPGYNASQQANYRQQYQGPQQHGNDLMRVPSEHPLGGPQRYQSQYSNDDNMAFPSGASQEFLQASRQPVFHSAPQSNQTQHSTPSQASSVEQCLSATIEVPYEKLCKATENFSAARKLGAGAFGEVFHAQLDMIDVAIKKIIKNENVKFNQSKIRGDQIKEIEALTKYRHKNIVCLTAYSFGPDCMCLIFDFMKNGSLEYQLEGRAAQGPLDWRRRHRIAEGAATGIQYLHTAETSRPLIHQDIKSANILLDENFVPKIADFGLARPGPRNGKEYTTIKTSVVFGTKAYLAPEFIRDPKRKLSKKLDVYSFGIVLLELVTGEKAGQAKRRFGTDELLWRCVEKIMDSNEGNLQEAAKKLQDRLCPDWPSNYMIELVQLAMKSTQEFKRRPDMEEVFQELSEMGVRIEEEERNRSSRTHNFPIENTDPLEKGKAVESSDPSQTTEGQDQFGANRRPGLHRLEERCKDDYGGFQALANGPKVQGNLINERPHPQESAHQQQDSRSNRDPFQNYMQMREGLRQDEMHARDKQMQMRQEEYLRMYERQYLPAVSTSGNSSMHVNRAQSQSSMSQSAESSYPSYLQSSSITSSSDVSGVHFQRPYMRHPQEHYLGPFQGHYAGGDPINPRLRHPLNMPQQHYQHNEQHPPCTPHHTEGPGPQDYGYQQHPHNYHQPDTRDQVQQRGEHLNPKGSVDLRQDDNMVTHMPPVSSSGSAGSSSSSDSRKAWGYPKMRTLTLPPLSILSSDTSNNTGETSVSQFSEDLPQNAGRGDRKAEESCQRERIGMLQSGREECTEQSNEVHRREPGENTEPQTQPCP